MRTRTIIVVECGTDRQIAGEVTVFCNDPDAVVVYAGKKGEPTVDECGCCGEAHLSTFAGDCQADNDRLYEPPLQGGEMVN